ncbi:MAG TPA: uroporphyrinogen decarboxylase family protein, partial [Pyrinomonadaceae bacterium]|nr:uroporphyrinogen decarboxylase family protein [Pyrinomonadaceae bacterium]
GPWTLFAYAVEGSHSGTLAPSKTLLHLFPKFCERLVPLLIRNIELQLRSGAELVMIFDTAAGELSPHVFAAEVIPQLELLAQRFPSRLGYYSKGTQRDHLDHSVFTDGDFAGIGVDYRWDLREALDLFTRGFVQGNFDPALLLCEHGELKKRLRDYLKPLTNHTRDGWVCGLGHGVLPGTPEENVRLFVSTVREVLS